MNRKLHNTFSALSVATLLTTACLMAAKPIPDAGSFATQQIGAVLADSAAVADADRLAQRAERAGQAAEASAKAVEQASLARAKAIEARSETLAKQLEGEQDVGKILGHVVGFTAEVVTETALNAAIEEITSADTAEASVAPPTPVRKPRQNRRSLAMPYFSFASRG